MRQRASSTACRSPPGIAPALLIRMSGVPVAAISVAMLSLRERSSACGVAETWKSVRMLAAAFSSSRRITRHEVHRATFRREAARYREADSLRRASDYCCAILQSELHPVLRVRSLTFSRLDVARGGSFHGLTCACLSAAAYPRFHVGVIQTSLRHTWAGKVATYKIKSATSSGCSMRARSCALTGTGR